MVHKTAEQGFSKEGFTGSALEVVEKAVARRETRVEGITGSGRGEVERIVRREGRILRTLVGRI